jgi:arabinogalactan endo-1,4-beta-galactosidase
MSTSWGKVQEIGVIITAEKDGEPYFTEEEKEDARQIIKASKINENDIAYLREFKDCLSEELAKRESGSAA